MQAYVHPTSVIDEGVIIGDGVRIWHFCHLMPGSTIGADCNLGQNVFVDAGVQLGKRVKVQNNVSIYTGVVIEDDVFVGPSAVFTNVLNPRSYISRKKEFKPTIIRRGATIGANATVICGVEIGEYALVGAGSVVTKGVLPFALVRGNPAVQVGWVSKAGLPLYFDDHQTIAECSQGGEKYELIENRVVILPVA